MRPFFHQLHLVLSIPFGLVITVICLTGATLVFEKEITEFFRRDLYTADPIASETLPLEVLAARVAATLPDSVSVTGITVFSDPRKAYQVHLSQPRRASICIDPYTGAIKGRSERPAFFTCMFKLHRWLLDRKEPGETVFAGKQIVGVSTLVLIVILLSGLAIWMPRTRKAVRNRLTIATGKGWRRFWYDLHVAGGMYAAIFLLAMALTGLTWSFPWYRTAFYAVFGVETKPSASHGNQQVAHAKPATPFDKRKSLQERPAGEISHSSTEKKTISANRRSLSEDRALLQKDAGNPSSSPHPPIERKSAEAFRGWQAAYEGASALQPDFRQLTVSKNSVSVSKDRFGNQRASDRYAFDPASGKITGETLYRDQEASGKIRGWIYSVHVGSWGGLTTRLLSFLASLLGGFLPQTGYYLWIKKRSRKKRKIRRTEAVLPRNR